MAILFCALMFITAHSRYAVVRYLGVSTGFIGMMFYTIVFTNQYLLK
jgi:hypothetical protein